MEAKDNKGKRKQILNAAVIIFDREGFNKATVEEIAKEAGVGKGTMYEYFKSKNDLFQKMMIEVSETYFNTFEDKISEASSIREKLQLILSAHLKFLKEHRAMANILMAEHHLFGEELRQWICKNQMEKLGKLQKLIEDGIDKKEFKSIDSKLQASVISAVVLSAGSYYITEQKADIDKIINNTMEIILYGLLPSYLK